MSIKFSQKRSVSLKPRAMESSISPAFLAKRDKRKEERAVGVEASKMKRFTFDATKPHLPPKFQNGIEFVRVS